MTASRSATGSRRNVASHAAYVGLALAVVSLLLLAAGPIGWRAGWWNFGLAFGKLMPWSAYLAAAGAVVALFTLLFRRPAAGHGGALVAVVALAANLALLYPPLHWYQMRGKYPPIDDITTDPENPPNFAAVLPARQAEQSNSTVYGGTATARQQREAYPDIAPALTKLPSKTAFDKALDAAEAMPGWRIVAEDPAAGRIEASQSSRWFGFTDDMVIRVTAGEAGSRIDIRSEARHGRGDFGVNAARVRAYLAQLRTELGGK